MNNWHRAKQISLIDVLLTINLAVGWLLPNHYLPWLAFHENAWVAISLLLIGLRCIPLIKFYVRITTSGLILIAISVLPWVQHLLGLLPLISDAILQSVYLFGAAVAYIIAQQHSRNRFSEFAGYIFVATSIASIISSGIATYQWLGMAQDLDLMNIWILPFSESTRPYANMAQPNQLATLLLCGLLGIGWIWNKRYLPSSIALIASAWILWGIALTESRTALLTLSAGIIYLSLVKPKYLGKKEIISAQILFLIFILFLFQKTALANFFGQSIPLSLIERSSGELRIPIWKMSLEASLHHPWLGYGWGRSNAGYFEVYENYKQIFENIYFEKSHNLILDLILWAGWPIAIGLTALGCFWLRRAARAVDSLDRLLVLMALCAFLAHAMLEFPLHYGYFLWPFFVLAGSISDHAKSDCEYFIKISSIYAHGIMLSLVVFVILVTIDYFKVEETFTDLRFQVARVGPQKEKEKEKINMFILRDWPDVIALSKATPHSGMSEEEINHWEALLLYNTAPLNLRKVIGAYKLNGKDAEARAWANRACWLLQEKACKDLYDEWSLATPIIDTAR